MKDDLIAILARELAQQEAPATHLYTLDHSNNTIQPYYLRVINHVLDFYNEHYNNLEEAITPISSYLMRVLFGDNVLGVAFPERGRGHSLEGLGKHDADIVIRHEVGHLNNPHKNEYWNRVDTGTLYFTPNPYLSTT